jgi:hypothetical protein
MFNYLEWFMQDTSLKETVATIQPGQPQKCAIVIIILPQTLLSTVYPCWNSRS